MAGGLARSGTQYFTTVLAAGFDAIVNERANRMTWPKGQMRYNIATLAELRTFEPIPYTIELDGEARNLEAMLVAVGNGLMFSFIPVRLGAAGFAPTWAGSILTGLSAGGIASCLLTGWVVRRVGHARAYILMSALIVLSNTASIASARATGKSEPSKAARQRAGSFMEVP